MRDAFARALHRTAKRRSEVFLIVADISPAASLNAFREEFPTRLVDVGVAEQSLVGVAAGLALRGFRPFAYTIATFTIYRPFEQVRDDLCYQSLPVTLVGVGAGLSYPALGATHWSQEDVVVMSALPNMSILAPCDPLELEFAVEACAAQNGPTYLRLGKAGEPNLTAEAPEPFQFGRLRRIRNGVGVAILSYGPIMALALKVASQMEQTRSEPPAVFSAHTLKPLDRDGVARVLHDFDQVIVVEEHSRQGGLGAQVKQIAWDSGARCRLHTFALQDDFLHVYGSQDELRRAHGLSVETILTQVR